MQPACQRQSFLANRRDLGVFSRLFVFRWIRVAQPLRGECVGNGQSRSAVGAWVFAWLGVMWLSGLDGVFHEPALVTPAVGEAGVFELDRSLFFVVFRGADVARVLAGPSV